MKRLGLRAKFIVLLSIMLLVLFAAATIVLVRQSSGNLRSALNQKSRSYATLATQPIVENFKLYQDSGRIRVKQQVDRYLDLDSDVRQIGVVDVNGQTLFNSDEKTDFKLSADQAAAFEPIYDYNQDGEIEQVIQPYIEDNGAHQYAVVYRVSSQRINDERRQATATIAGFSLLALLLSIALSYLLINRFFLRPVSRVSRQALLISHGNWDSQISMDRRDEIGDMAAAVNTMAETLKADITKLQELDKLKNEFMMITSHNLRTPLTVINGYLELLKSLEPSAEMTDVINKIGAGTLRLGAFAEDVLIISMIEAGDFKIDLQPAPLKALLDKIVQDFGLVAAQKQLQFSGRLELTDQSAKINRSYLRSALWNLLDNAYKFTPEGGNVALTASADANNVKITVSDSGIGIAAAEKPKLFTKFHRGTSTEQYDYEGTGIGLYLTKLIVEQHNGRISCDSAEGQGTTFTITLPLSAK